MRKKARFVNETSFSVNEMHNSIKNSEKEWGRGGRGKLCIRVFPLPRIKTHISGIKISAVKPPSSLSAEIIPPYFFTTLPTR